MFSLWVKWPEKAVSESSHELAQLSFLVQAGRACVRHFPALRGSSDARGWCRRETVRFWCRMAVTRQQSLRQCRPQPVM
ncbi:hypothetical protein BBG26_14155 [Salmonella enterica]|nr:hypothetical protein [Salmonella enterica]